jgi:ketosteroid isomerase-like protein
MAVNSPQHAVELLDQAFNQGDLDAVLSFYEEAAVVVAEPNRVVRGPELRNFFEEAMRSGLSAKQLKTRVIEADGIALFLSRWTLTPRQVSSNLETRTFVATTVFRQQQDGTWKILIDNSIGPLLVESERM